MNYLKLQIFKLCLTFSSKKSPFSFLIDHILDEPPTYHLNSIFLFNSLLYTCNRKDCSYLTLLKARLQLPLTIWDAKIQVNLTTKAPPEARGRILSVLSRMPGTGVDLLKGNSVFDKISEQFMSLYPCSFSFLLCRNVN